MSPGTNKPDATAETTAHGIVSSRLTTCEISQDGKAVRLYLLDHAGDPAFVEFPFDQAESVVMTLPRLLTAALRVRTGGTDARYVFPVDHWSLELTRGEGCLLLTLRTEDGFEVCFGIPFEMCKSMSSAMAAGFEKAAACGLQTLNKQ
jgi:hypothetical protein